MCGKCGETRPVSDFHRRGAAGYQWACIYCQREINRDNYAGNRERHSKLVQSRKKEITEWSNGLKSSPCVDCGGMFHYRAMQWDHVGSDKLINVSEMVVNGYGRDRILAEIAKCELVCANCHAVRTFNRENNLSPRDAIG